MNIENRSRRLRRRLSFALALAVSCSLQFPSFVLAHPAAATYGQKQTTSTSDERANSRKQQLDDRSVTRSRRAEPHSEILDNRAAVGPIIRVALMTDVNSVTIDCSSGLILKRTAEDPTKNLQGGSVTVELRKQRETATATSSSIASYRVSVGSSIESGSVRKLVDELKKRFFEPVSMTFDEKHKEYSALIGQFSNRNDATKFLERLQKSGYETLRIVSEAKTASTDSTVDGSARSAKEKPQPGDTSASSRSTAPADRRLPEMIALVANKVAASSASELIVSPAENPYRSEPGGRQQVSSGDDQRGKLAAKPTQPEILKSQSDATSTPPALRIANRDYRGEIHLVLNGRGRINVVNALPLEEYLRGVVPMELSPGAFPEMEALKAQAVAARSYALVHLGQRRDEGFDLVDDTRAQVYGGLSSEREMTNRAIDETRGMVAVFPNEDGKLVPIEALYTANCGGRTENNDEVFGGKAVPYLRAVACAVDRQSFAAGDIVTSRTRESLTGIDGRSINREVGLLTVLGFSLPRRVTTSYLSRTIDRDEVRSWIEQAARLTQKDTAKVFRDDATRTAEFIRLVAVSVYGEGRASTLLAPADVDYLLGGLRIQQLPNGARADVALLLKDGILKLPADTVLDGQAPMTRGYAIETLARAISITPQAANLKTQDSKPQTAILKTQIRDLTSDIAVPSENGRLIIAASGSSRDGSSRERTARFTSLNTAGSGRLSSPQKDESTPTKAAGSEKDGATGKRTARQKIQQNPTGLEIAEGAWLYRNLAGESHQVDRLTLIGGERVKYHLNAAGQVDFLEATISDRSAASDRFSSVAQWQERITIEELQQRLARVRINVGHLEKVEPVAFSSSSRVTEVEVSGDKGRARLRRPQIRAVLGLKEFLFVVDNDNDERGQVVAFVFTGRGWGHGVGMCQTGAYGLAREGYSYAAILQKYYTGVRLQKLY